MARAWPTIWGAQCRAFVDGRTKGRPFTDTPAERAKVLARLRRAYPGETVRLAGQASGTRLYYPDGTTERLP